MSAPPAEHAHHEEFPQPVARPFFTPGVFILLAVMLTGMVAYAWRFIFGLASVTNLDQQHPWGLWVGVDVASGVALAAGGFAAVAMVRVFHMRQFEPLVRPALLTALLGYTAVVTGLLADLGRYYNVWHPLMPWMWQGNSVLFEVGICEVGCLNLLYLIFAPIFLERLRDEKNRLPRLAKLAARVHPMLERVMPPFIIAGLIAALLHQSALGNLLVITPYKLHPLWHSPYLSALFLISAIGGGGLAMMCWESLFASWSLKLAPEMHVLSRLAKLVWPVMGIYLLAKVADVIARGGLTHLRDSKVLAACWLAEVILGLLVPVVMLMLRRVRENPRRLFFACTLIVFGVIFNRVNVFVIAYKPPYGKRYIPSFGEFAITCGLFAFLMLGYRLVVTLFPVISQPASAKQRSSKQEPEIADEELAVPSPAVAQLVLSKVGPVAPVLLILAASQFAHAQSTQPTQDIPNIVMLDQLSKSEGLYEPVPFNHKAHATMAQIKDQCTTCHHRTPEATTTRASSNGNAKIGGQQADAAKHPACRTCHEPHRADLRQPGLKGAYHRQCLNCHREWAEANNCNVCHKPVQFAATGPAHNKLATEDDIVGRMHPPIPEPKVKTFKTELTPADGPLVVFRHTEHTGRYGLSCATCHRDDACSRCHQPSNKVSKPIATAPRTELAEADWETVHRNCNSCHPRQETHCNTCHYKTEQQPPAPFEHAITGQLLDADHAKLHCNACHSTWTPKAAITCGTSGCHVTTNGPVTFPAMRPGPVLPAKKDLPPVKVIPVPLKDGKTKIASGGAP